MGNSECYSYYLGGGNSNIFFQPEKWGDDPIWQAYFSNGLKPPISYDMEQWKWERHFDLRWAVSIIWQSAFMNDRFEKQTVIKYRNTLKYFLVDVMQLISFSRFGRQAGVGGMYGVASLVRCLPSLKLTVRPWKVAIYQKKNHRLPTPPMFHHFSGASFLIFADISPNKVDSLEIPTFMTQWYLSTYDALSIILPSSFSRIFIRLPGASQRSLWWQLATTGWGKVVKPWTW